MAETIEDLRLENKKLKDELKEANEVNATYRINGGVGLYYELNRLVNETINYTRNTSISSLLTDGEKGDKKFERTMALIKNAKEHILDLEEIKIKLKLTGNETKDKEKVPFIETVAETRK